MSRLWAFLFPIQPSLALPLSAQADVHQQLRTAAQLASQGHYQEAIELARPALETEQSI
jgi:hypothetical protein